MKETIFTEYAGFEWDDGNRFKNADKHAVSCQACEEVFFNDPLLLFEDIKHSQEEFRMFALGKTNENRKLFVVFTTRESVIRIISARNMSKKERAIYEQAKKNT